MSGDLQQRLADLADDAPGQAHVRGDAAGELWRRGRRRRVRERFAAGLALLVVLAGLGSVAGLVRLDRGGPAPVAPDGRLGLPDRLYTPSPWTGSTKGHPIGPIAIVFGAERHWWPPQNRAPYDFAAVSAVTGEYRFLDLPGAAYDTDSRPADALSVSPDGRYIGYWTRDGYAVYDTVSGLVRSFDVPGGDYPIGKGVAWTAGGAWFQWVRLTDDQEGYTQATTALVDLASGKARVLTEPVPDFDQLTSDGRRLVQVGGRRVTVLAGPGQPPLRLSVNRDLASAYLSPGGRRLVGFPATNRCCTERPLLLGQIGQGRSVSLQRLPEVIGVRVVGWRDDRQVVVLRNDGGLDVFDVATGASQRLVAATRINRPLAANNVVAAGLLTEPSLPGVPPPDVMDPRLRLGLWVGGGVAALFLAVIAWNRWDWLQRRWRGDA